MTEHGTRTREVEQGAPEEKTLIEILYSLEGKIDDKILSSLRAKAEADALSLAAAKDELELRKSELATFRSRLGAVVSALSGVNEDGIQIEAPVMSLEEQIAMAKNNDGNPDELDQIARTTKFGNVLIELAGNTAIKHETALFLAGSKNYEALSNLARNPKSDFTDVLDILTENVLTIEIQDLYHFANTTRIPILAKKNLSPDAKAKWDKSRRGLKY